MLHLSVLSSSKCRLFHNSTFFGSSIIHILYTGVLKFKRKFRRQSVKLPSVIVFGLYKFHTSHIALYSLNILSHTTPRSSLPSVTHQCLRKWGIILLDNTKKYGLKKNNGQDQLHLAFECILYANSNRLLRSQSFIGLINLIIIIIIINVVSCHRPFLPGTSLEPVVILTAQASIFTLQYFPYYVWCSKYSCLL